MQLRIIVQCAAAKRFVPVGDRPADHHAKPGAHADQQIEVQQKNGLYCASLTCRVLDDEIPIIELGMKRILDQFVISMVLALVCESDLPARTALQIVARDDFETPRISIRDFDIAEERR